MALMRRGAVDTVASLVKAPLADFGNRFGEPFAAAVGDLVTEASWADRHAIRGASPSRATLPTLSASTSCAMRTQPAIRRGSRRRSRRRWASTAAVAVRDALRTGRTAQARGALLAVRGLGPAHRARGSRRGTARGRRRSGGPRCGRRGLHDRAGSDDRRQAGARLLAADAIPGRASGSIGKLVDAVGAGGGEPGAGGDRPATGHDPAAASHQVLADMHNFKLAAQAAGEVLEPSARRRSARRSAKDAIESARNAITDEVVAEVRRAVEQRYPGVEVRLHDLGMLGFGQRPRRDAARRAASRRRHPARAQRARFGRASRRSATHTPRSVTAGSIPTSPSTPTSTPSCTRTRCLPADAAERSAISGDQSIVSLTEMRMGMSDLQVGPSAARADDADHRVRRPEGWSSARWAASMERQFAAAEARAARLGRGEPALQAARQRLLRWPPSPTAGHGPGSCATSRPTSSCSSPTPTAPARRSKASSTASRAWPARRRPVTGRRRASTSAGSAEATCRSRSRSRTAASRPRRRSPTSGTTSPKARRRRARCGRWRRSSPGSPTRSRKPGFRCAAVSSTRQAPSSGPSRRANRPGHDARA